MFKLNFSVHYVRILLDIPRQSREKFSVVDKGERRMAKGKKRVAVRRFNN